MAVRDASKLGAHRGQPSLARTNRFENNVMSTSSITGPTERQKFETCPDWGGNPVCCLPAILFCLFSLPVRTRVRPQSGLEPLAAFDVVLKNGLCSPSRSEGGRISHLPANSIQSTWAKFPRQEGVRRKRAFERACFPAGEPKARIVIGMTENDNDVFAAPPQQIEAMPDQPSTDVLSPIFW